MEQYIRQLPADRQKAARDLVEKFAYERLWIAKMLVHAHEAGKLEVGMRFLQDRAAMKEEMNVERTVAFYKSILPDG